MREYRGGRDRKERLKVVSLVQMRRAKNGSSRGTGAVTFLKSASTLEGSPSFCAALFTAVNAQDISIQDEKSDDCAVINWTNQTPDYNSSFYAARF
jgi:hypothetical protein